MEFFINAYKILKNVFSAKRLGLHFMTKQVGKTNYP